MSGTAADFMNEARGILGPGVSPERLAEVGRRLAQAASQPGFIPDAELHSLHGGDSVATLIQTDADGLTLMLAQFSPGEATPVHDHGSWGVACVVRGRDRYQHWERLDDGSRPDRAQVRVLYDKVLGPGEFVTWPGPPGDVHSQQGVDAPALELVLFGRNVLEGRRHYFDPVTGAVRTELPQ
jgi:predicted metal-dependent enzyme (double-stranded beta helix superfamily)